MRRLVLLGVLAGLVLAPTASAKMCVKIATVPARPVTGQVTTIRMTAWTVVIANGGLRRGDRAVGLAAGTRLDVRATSPAGVSRLVHLRSRGEGDSVLVGRFVFPSAGSWTLAWSAFSPRRAGECAGLTRVRVTGR